MPGARLEKRNQAEARLIDAITQANRTLGQIASQEAKFHKEHGESEYAFVKRCAAARRRQEKDLKNFSKNFDVLIGDVNLELSMLEGKSAAVSPRPGKIKRKGGKSRRAKAQMEKSEESLTKTDLSSHKEDAISDPLGDLNTELNQLEQRMTNIEKRIREDIEAEEIGISFPIAEIIEYMTALKVSMYKRHLIQQALFIIALNDNRYESEAKGMKKGYAVWTRDERLDLLSKMSILEGSLNKLEQFPIMRDEAFNKYFPLMTDLIFLKKLVARFLDKYENIASSPSTSTARLATPEKYTEKKDILKEDIKMDASN